MKKTHRFLSMLLMDATLFPTMQYPKGLEELVTAEHKKKKSKLM